MAPLNIHPDESATKKRKNNKALKILLGIGALIAVPAIGSTLAAQITIGGDTAIQFGQGVQQATACDNAITVTAASSFDNTTSAGSFNMGDVVISGIDDDCNTKKFTVRLFGDSSDTAVATCVVDNLNGSGGSATAVTSATACSSGTGGVTYTSTVSSDANTLTAKFGSASSAIAASGVYKITVETA